MEASSADDDDLGLTPESIARMAQAAIRAGEDYPTEEPCVMCHRFPTPVALRDKATRQAYQDLRLDVIRAMSRAQPQTIMQTPGFDRRAMPLVDVVREMLTMDQHDLLARLLWIAGKGMSSDNPDLRHEALAVADTIAHHHAIFHREDLTDERDNGGAF